VSEVVLPGRALLEMISSMRIFPSSIVAIYFGYTFNLATGFCQAEDQQAVLPSGQKVILKSDGHWERSVELTGKTSPTNYYEDENVKVSFEFVPGSMDLVDETIDRKNHQRLVIRATNKSATKIIQFEPTGKLSLQDNFGNFYRTGGPVRDSIRLDPTEPGKTEEWDCLIQQHILPNATNLVVSVTQEGFNTKRPLEIVVPLNGAQLKTVAKQQPNFVEAGARYKDDSVSIDFVYESGWLKSAKADLSHRFMVGILNPSNPISRNTLIITIKNISRSRMVYAQTHHYATETYLVNGTDVPTGWVQNIFRIKDNFGNELSDYVVDPNLASKALSPHDSEKAIIYIKSKLLGSASSLTLRVEPGYLGNSGLFEVNIPLKAGGSGSVNYRPRWSW